MNRASSVGAALLLLVGCELPPGGAETPACGSGTHAENERGCRVDRESDALLEIAHTSQMSGTFELVSVGYSLDGRPMEWKPHSVREMGRTPQAILFAASPGAHLVALRFLYKGRKALDGYAFQLDTWHEVKVERGRVVEAAVVQYERGDGSLPPEERPAARWLVR